MVSRYFDKSLSMLELNNRDRYAKIVTEFYTP